jgi:hypothetical protein
LGKSVLSCAPLWL